MTDGRRVVWHDGLLLRPQHFQQLERSVDARVAARLGPAAAEGWGFDLLRLDAAAARAGTLAIEAARGVMPDGTPFDIPDQARAPAPWPMPPDAGAQVVHLALPWARAGVPEGAFDGASHAGERRWRPGEQVLADAWLADAEPATVAVAEPALHWRVDDAPAEGWCRLPAVRVLGRGDDGALRLDDQWVPPVRQLGASPVLSAALREARQLLRSRAEALARRLSPAGGAGATAEADTLLQLVLANLHEARLAALRPSAAVPVRRLHDALVAAVAALASFDPARGRLPAEPPPYRHEDPGAGVRTLMTALRGVLAEAPAAAAEPVALTRRAEGLFTAQVGGAHDPATRVFVLAAAADVPPDVLRRRLPAQLKAGPADRLRDVVRLQLPAIRLDALPVAPPQVPYYAGHCYFQLDPASDWWTALARSRLLALHVAGEFPGLRLALWALRP